MLYDPAVHRSVPVRVRHARFDEQLLADLDVAAGTAPGDRRAAFRRLRRLFPEVRVDAAVAVEMARQIREQQLPDLEPGGLVTEARVFPGTSPAPARVEGDPGCHECVDDDDERHWRLWEERGCLDGRVFGPCGHPYCGGYDEDEGPCPCTCHEEGHDG